MKTTNKQGEVKVVNALATIHQIFDEIAPNGSMECIMESTKGETVFAFIANGICATLHVQEFKAKKGGKL